MTTIVKDSSSNTNSVTELRISIQRFEEGEANLRKLRQFVENGGEIRWVVDTDVVHLFLNPKSKQRYADIFVTEGRGDDRSSLVALAALLADFIFSDRFALTLHRAESSRTNPSPRLLLEPHVEELHDAIQSIAKHAARDVVSAHGATSGQLEKRIRALMNEYAAGKVCKEMTQEKFVKNILEEIEHSISLILPDRPLTELIRARDLLKERNSIAYQANDENLHARLSTRDSTDRIHQLTDFWFDRIRSLAHETVRDSVDRTGTINSKRPNEIERETKDAEVLAKLQLLNEEERANKIRYVLISGHGFLHGLIRRNRSLSLFAVRPRDFLGNPRLFELDAQDERVLPKAEHDARWKRITRALNLIGSDFDESNPELQARIQGLAREWESVQRMALPNFLIQSSAPSLRQVAKELFDGKSGEALDTWIYVAMSEFFVVTAELGLLAHRDSKPPTIKRKPPPLRLAFYPQAERFICQVIDGEFWGNDDTIDLSRVATQIKAVKQEQMNLGATQKSANFNYPLLLCLSSRFASLDDWHAARVLAAHAKAVIHVTENSPAFVTGREASLLEAYSRRLEARNKHDLEDARAALQEFREKTDLERKDWFDAEKRRSFNNMLLLHKFNPESEFPLHDLRADTDELIIDFTEVMFDCFTEPDHSTTTSKVVSNRVKFISMIKKVEAYLDRLEQLEIFQPGNPGSAVTILVKIRGFLQTQLELCGLQCSLFVIAGSNDEYETTERDPCGQDDLLDRVYKHGSVIAKLAALVGRCVWGTQDQRTQATTELATLGNGDLLIYDKGRQRYLIDFARSVTNN